MGAMKSDWWNGRSTAYGGVALLSLAAFLFIYWQNTRVAALWDLSYLLDTSWRIACGQMPYRDFPLVHAPLTFLTQAGVIKLFGRNYFVVIMYGAGAGAASVFVGYLALLRLSGQAWVALGLTVPLVFLSTQGVYPHTNYDTDCGLALLVAVWLLMELAARERPTAQRAFWTGAVVVVPIFYKQNMGLPFALAVGSSAVAVLILSLARRERVQARMAAVLLAGMLSAVLLALLLISLTAGLGNYYHWTIEFAAARRMPGLGLVVAMYKTQLLYWALPVILLGALLLWSKFAARLWARGVGFVLMCAPFVWTLWQVLTSEDADDKADALLALWPLVLALAGLGAVLSLRRGVTLTRLIPLVILAAIHGAFLSQQLWGSTYAIWPLLMLLVAGLAMELRVRLAEDAQWVGRGLVLVLVVVFAVSGGVYAASLERLNYVGVGGEEDGQEAAPSAQRSQLSVLRGMATPGEALANLDELVGWTKENIPANEAMILLPGEDPFYYATGRVPRFPVLLMDPATDPYSAEDLMGEARRRGVRWVIVKTRLQSLENPMPERERTLELVGREFRLAERLRGYEVWRR